MSEPLIRARGLEKAFEEGRIVALRGMDLEVAEGEFVAIVGPSGCGKSTLLHLIAALDMPDKGRIRVGEHELESGRDLSHYRARQIGMVFQLHNLLPSLTALENVQVPMFELSLGRRERKERARRLLALVGLGDREGNLPPELSGGERQRVGIARALANDPPILLADEPTGSLDSESGSRILDLLETLRRERGLTVVLVTHDAEVAARADRIVRMLDGRLLREQWARHAEPVGTKAGAQQSAGQPQAPSEPSTMRAFDSVLDGRRWLTVDQRANGGEWQLPKKFRLGAGEHWSLRVARSARHRLPGRRRCRPNRPLAVTDV